LTGTVALLVLLVWSLTAPAQNNPRPTALVVPYENAEIKPGGGTHSGVIEWPVFPDLNNPNRGLWVPQFQGWNNRNTKLGTKIENVDTTGVSFPIDYLLGDGRTVRITAANVDAYFDRIYNRVLYRRQGTANFNSNCYGYATAKGYWVTPTGFDAIVQDEYQIFQEEFCKENCVVRMAAEAHAIRLIAAASTSRAALSEKSARRMACPPSTGEGGTARPVL
jgi:hypothetical protein